MQSFNPLTFPFSGRALIEASAGTGKTFNIIILYLRLLLGLGGDHAYRRCLSVQEILVVTFTKAATAELRDRIGEMITKLRLACDVGYSNEAVLADLLIAIPDRFLAQQQLLMAEQQLDTAAIYTIHGFCQKILKIYALEVGALFEQTLVENPLPLWQQACADFWRCHFYPLSHDQAAALFTHWPHPDALLKDLMLLLRGKMPQLLSSVSVNETIAERHNAIIARIDAVKQAWLNYQAQLSDVLETSELDKRRYNNKHLINWRTQILTWAKTATHNYILPAALTRFRLPALAAAAKNPITTNPLFTAIETLYQHPLDLRDLVLTLAVQDIRQRIALEKAQRLQIDYDDLIFSVHAALQQKKNHALADAIRLRYPVAVIDEFQDTDALQYDIFCMIYPDMPAYSLVLIGDPKQAIYAFRGANIFAYLQARRQIKHQYTLKTNWRSAATLVSAVNMLFQSAPAPFFFAQIPFYPATAVSHNHELAFIAHNQYQPALQLYLSAEIPISVETYEQSMARHCAEQIKTWINGDNLCAQTVLEIDRLNRRVIKATDIAILVRNRVEAKVMQAALNNAGVPSCYVSDRSNVFDTTEAQELWSILNAVLRPENDAALRCALATYLLGVSAEDIYQLNNEQQKWHELTEQFISYRDIWKQFGPLPLFNKIMEDYHITARLLNQPGCKQQLVNVLHLSELLQAKSAQLESEYALLNWFSEQIVQPDLQAADQQIRVSADDQEVIQIVTIHKAKGLEYAIVWIPFASNFRHHRHIPAYYHDRASFEPIYDLGNHITSQQYAQEEYLAEELRLLYVALTRAIYHCCIGVAQLSKASKKAVEMHRLNRSALHYLLDIHSMDDLLHLKATLSKSTREIRCTTIPIKDDSENIHHSASRSEDEMDKLVAKKFTHIIGHSWRITSYSELIKNRLPPVHHASASLHHTEAAELMPDFEQESMMEKNLISEHAIIATVDTLYTQHTFPRGAIAGTFLHRIFEQLDFCRPILPSHLAPLLTESGFDPLWDEILASWLNHIAQRMLHPSGVTLAQLSKADRLIEFEFNLAIDAAITATALQQVMSRYDPLSAQAAPLYFSQVQGMMKGFIDLVFVWQGKFYLLDYKSNWLGESSAEYHQQNLIKAIIDHRYDLQYQIYSLALHRYLQLRLPNYHFSHHFGGVIYLFLRGLDFNYPQHGIFSCMPDAALITALDQLFRGK